MKGLLSGAQCENLHDTWRDIIKDHEAQSYQAFYGMDPVARLNSDERKIASLFESVRRSCVLLTSFTAVEDYCFAAKVRDYGSDEIISNANSSDEWAQQLLVILSNAPKSLMIDPRSLPKRPRGRPAIEFRYCTSDRLIRAWHAYGLPETGSTSGVKGLLRFHDEVTSRIELQFHAAWASHTLSSRWPDHDDQPLTAPETFSYELGRLRPVLRKRAREGRQPASGE